MTLEALLRRSQGRLGTGPPLSCLHQTKRLELWETGSLSTQACLTEEFMERYRGREGLEDWNDVIRHWILGMATGKEEKDGSWGGL